MRFRTFIRGDFDYKFNLFTNYKSIQIFQFFMVAFVFLGICPFYLGYPICMSILLNLLKFNLWPKLWFILVNDSCALEKKAYAVVSRVFCLCLLDLIDLLC